MAGFADLFDSLYSPPHNQSAEPHVIGTTLWIDLAVIDGNKNAIDLSSGYTVAMTPYVNGVALATFTQTLTNGRLIILGIGSIIVSATPAASLAMFADYPDKTVLSNLVVTRTSDGARAVIWRECYIPLRPKRNP